MSLCRHSIESHLYEGELLASVTRHIPGLFQSIPGTHQFNQCLIIDWVLTWIHWLMLPIICSPIKSMGT